MRSFLGPLVLTFTISLFVLLMRFVWVYIDDMVGKGLDFIVIAKLLLYASATFVPMALPIAVLFASIMTMGNFGEQYELVAMKAGGVSLRRVMVPMAIVCVLLTGVAYYFANDVVPIAFLKYKTTLYDVTRKKPAINFRPSEYYSEIEGYVIRVDGKDEEGSELRDVTIYDHSTGIDETQVTVAKRGRMEASADGRTLLFTLYDGYTYSEGTRGEDYESRPLLRIGFERQVLSFDVSGFAFENSDENFFKGNYRTMSVTQLKGAIAGVELSLDSMSNNYQTQLGYKLNTYARYKACVGTTKGAKWGGIDDAADYMTRSRMVNQAIAMGEMTLADIQSSGEVYRDEQEYENYMKIEWQRRYTLSIACLLLFLVGAPFGSIVRKGGLGVPLVASVLFFVFYYMIGMIAEKMVRQGVLGPIGMWFSTFVFLPVGVLLTLYAAGDLRNPFRKR